MLQDLSKCSFCAPGYYLTSDSTCASSCVSPYTQKASNLFLACVTPCEAAQTFFMPNGGCNPACNYPMIATNSVSGKLCNYCPTGLFTYWDSTCQSTCSNPYIINTPTGYKECATPCQAAGTFMLQDFNCVALCNSPMVPSTVGQAKFCNPPCGPSNFIFSNGSCSTACPYIERSDGTYLYCDLCPSGEYQYANKTCIPKCDPPYKTSSFDNQNFCQSPCIGQTGSYYDISMSSCAASCNPPAYIYDNIFCIPNAQPPASGSIPTPTPTPTPTPIPVVNPPTTDTPANDKTETNSDSKAKSYGDIANTGGNISNIAATISGFVNPSDPSAFSIVALVKMIQYIRYIEVGYSPELLQVLRKQKPDGGLVKFMPSIPLGVKNKFVKKPLPYNFEIYGHHSSFLVNFWQYLMLLAIICACVIVSSIIEFFTRKYKTVHSICNKITQSLRWNVSIMLFVTLFDGVIVHTALDIITSGSLTLPETFSCITYVVVNTLIIVLLIKITVVLKDIRQSKRVRITVEPAHSDSPHLPIEKWKAYEVVHTTFKEMSFFQQSFLLIFILRVCFFYIIIAYLFNYPLVQVILITLLSIFMLLYITVFRPLKQFGKLVQNIVQEAVVLVVNVCVLILAILDALGKESERTREIIGQVIMNCNTFFSVAGSAIMIVSAGFTVLSKLRASQSKSAIQNETVRPVSIAILVQESNLTGLSSMKRKGDESVLDQSQVNRDEIHKRSQTVDPGSIMKNNRDIHISRTDRNANELLLNTTSLDKLSESSFINRSNMISENTNQMVNITGNDSPSPNRKINRMNPNKKPRPSTYSPYLGNNTRY